MSRVNAATLVEAIRDWGVDFRPYRPDWATQTTAGGWDPVGIGHHHTAGSGVLDHEPGGGIGPRQRSMLELLRNGRSDLDGPLCHFAPLYVGRGKLVVYGIGMGNTNHAGYIGARVAEQLRKGKFKGVDASGRGREDVDGNSMLYGLEYLHPGDGTPWPDELLEAGHRTAAAICDAHGWKRDNWAGSNAEHRELTARKVDRSWPGWGDGMRAAITELAATGVGDPAPSGWRRSPDIQLAIRTLVRAADKKLAYGRKAQHAALREHVRELREQFPSDDEA